MISFVPRGTISFSFRFIVVVILFLCYFVIFCVFSANQLLHIQETWTLGLQIQINVEVCLSCFHVSSSPAASVGCIVWFSSGEVESATCYSSLVNRSHSAAGCWGLTLLLHYISASGCTAAFCPRLVRWQDVVVGGWYLPRTVTCSQSKQGQADFRRFTERKNMRRKNRLLHWKTATVAAAISSSLLLEKSQQVSSTLSDWQTYELNAAAASVWGRADRRGRADQTATPF